MSRHRSSSSSWSAGVSRRCFLRGAGITAAGAVVFESGVAAVAEENARAAEPKVLGPGPVSITLRVNGQDKSIKVEPRTTLAEALRLNLDMTGTKVVCDRGSCSACTVMIDGATACSCMTLALDAVGREIRTIEGVAAGDQLHPVQEKFIEHDGMQCGFCTPGMVMSCIALLEKNPDPNAQDVKDATSGNLCRCGTYPKVFEATLAAAKAMGGQPSAKGA